MILVLGGTKEAVELNKQLNTLRVPFITTVVSSYGASLIENSCEVIKGNLDQQGLLTLIDEKEIDVIIDMTHPYAEQISNLAFDVSQLKEITYYRYLRPETVYQSHLIHKVDTYDEAAVKAVDTALENHKSIFLTIGSRRIRPFIQEARNKGVKIVCRVLPDPGVLEMLTQEGLTPKEIVAVLGPFSHNLNKAMFNDFKAGVIVTKDAGQVGGTDTKITAALELDIPVVIIRRPKCRGKYIFDNIDDILRRVTKK